MLAMYLTCVFIENEIKWLTIATIRPTTKSRAIAATYGGQFLYMSYNNIPGESISPASAEDNLVEFDDHLLS